MRTHCADGRLARGIGEPIWKGRSADELVECGRDEALINLAFAEGRGFTLMCPYDIGSLDAFKKAVLSASSVAHSRQGWSGLYFAKLLERLGLVAKLKKRIIVDKGPVAALIASGEAELGAQLLCELAPVSGIDIVGPLPAEVQGSVAFAAAVMSTSTKRAGAQAFLDFLGTAAAQDAMRKNLLTPAPRSPRRPG